MYKIIFLITTKTIKYIDIDQRKYKIFTENEFKTTKAHTRKSK